MAGPRPVVYECPRQRSAQPSSLEDAILRATADLGGTEFVEDVESCLHARLLARTFSRQGGGNPFRSASRHSYSLVRINGEFLSVDEYAFPNPRDLQRAVVRLSKLADKGLGTKATTTYRWFPIGDSILLFVFDVHSSEATRRAIDAIAEQFRLEGSRRAKSR